MKLLLTSAGVRNQSLADALHALHGKLVGDVKIGFVPTAANIEGGNKDWFIAQLTRLQSYGYTWIDVIDIAAADVDWRTRLAEVDVIVVSGGNTFYLLDQIRKSGFDVWLKEHIDSKVYVGMSAGSIVATPSIAIASADYGDVNIPNLTDLTGMTLVPFEVSPHTPESVSHEANKAHRAEIQHDLYALDDASAVQVIDGAVSVISEGAWVTY
jgi:dipeptidase E